MESINGNVETQQERFGKVTKQSHTKIIDDAIKRRCGTEITELPAIEMLGMYILQNKELLLFCKNADLTYSDRMRLNHLLDRQKKRMAGVSGYE